jgi:thiamine biosynthesis protein ThiI
VFISQKLDCVVRREYGRLFLYTNDVRRAIEILKRIFGIVSVSEVTEIEAEIPEISRVVCDYARKLIAPGRTFAICSRRTGLHKFTSQDIARAVGGAVLSAMEGKHVSVDLSNPDVKIYIEVRGRKAYVFSDKVPGPGGLPLGTQGKAVGLVIDRYSIIAIWLIMRRGCNVVPVYFDDEQEESETIRDLIDVLKVWHVKMKPYKILWKPSAESYCAEGVYSEEIWEAVARAAERLRADAIVSGERLAQLQARLSKRRAGHTVDVLPVFYPLVGLNTERIERYAKLIGL